MHSMQCNSCFIYTIVLSIRENKNNLASTIYLNLKVKLQEHISYPPSTTCDGNNLHGT